MKRYYVYIMTNQSRTLYIGVTNDLVRRVYEHKESVVNAFTKQYGVHSLVYYEIADDPEAAITREKQMKKWRRAWKLQLIEAKNPEWVDLSGSLIG